jgi:hypothetical protein
MHAQPRASCLVALLALTAPGRALADDPPPSAKDVKLALTVKTVQERVDDIKERNARTKARFALYRAALREAESLAKTPQEALEHAQAAPPAPEPVLLGPVRTK